MYSLSARFNKIFFYGLTNLAILCTLNYLSGVYIVKDRKVDVDFKFLNHYYFQNFKNDKFSLRWDVLVSTFSLKIKNMKEIEHWNLKQFFIYLEAVWEENGKKNEVIFWDRIMPRRFIKDVIIKKERFEYELTDINNNLRGKKMTINLWIEHIPVFGWIHRRKYGSFETVLPEKYTT